MDQKKLRQVKFDGLEKVEGGQKSEEKFEGVQKVEGAKKLWEFFH